jgi:hypothetical protein
MLTPIQVEFEHLFSLVSDLEKKRNVKLSRKAETIRQILLKLKNMNFGAKTSA